MDTTTQQATLLWRVIYNDGSVLLKEEDNGKVNRFEDIDQSKLDTVEIWVKEKLPVPNPNDPSKVELKEIKYPQFLFRFHPGAGSRLILFTRGIEEHRPDGQIYKYYKLFFGWQMTIGTLKKKNFQWIWSIRSDTKQLTVEERTGREGLSLNPGEKK